MIGLLSRFFAWLSPESLGRIASVLGWVWYRLIPVRVAVAREGVARAFPEASREERERIVLGSLRHLILSGLELFALLRWSDERLIGMTTVEGLEERIRAAQAEGHGFVMATSHQGPFEVLMGYGGARHPECPGILIARMPNGGFSRALLEAVRRRTKFEIFPAKDSMPAVVARVRENHGMVGFASDQNLRRGKGAFTTYFGRTASQAYGFSLIARRAGIPVVVAELLVRERPGKYRAVVTDFPLSEHPHLQVALHEDAWRMAKTVEAQVRRKPEQYLWVHRRWKTQPLPGDPIRTDRGFEIAGGGRVGALLDRDGVVNYEIGRAILKPEELSLVRGAAEAIRRLNQASVPVAIVTNQAAVARGQITVEQLGDVHDRMLSLLAKEGARVDGIFFCPHHPTEGVGELKVDCECRKPKPGLLLQAGKRLSIDLAHSLFVGDRATDVAAARAAGMRATLMSGGWAHRAWEPAEADDIAPDPVAAVDRFFDRLLGTHAPAAAAAAASPSPARAAPPIAVQERA